MHILIAFLFFIFGVQSAIANEGPVWFDDFTNQKEWEIGSTEAIKINRHAIKEQFEFDYDFNKTAGFIYLKRAIKLNLTQDFQISFQIRGTGLENILELKLIDEAGQNVHWKKIENFKPKEEWQTIIVKKRDIEFAWGVDSDKELQKLGRIELVLKAKEGGVGKIEIDNLRIDSIKSFPNLKPRAFSKFEMQYAKTKNGKQIIIDLGREFEIGGLSLKWEKRPNKYDIYISQNGETFTKFDGKSIRRAGFEYIRMPQTFARFIRLNANENENFNLSNARVENHKFAEDENYYFEERANFEPIGNYPRALREQEYWTIFGGINTNKIGLISEDGRIETTRGGFSIAPIVISDKKHSWADVEIHQTLMDEYLPIPNVEWRAKNFTLQTNAFGDEFGHLFALYKLKNKKNSYQRMELRLQILPLQVNGQRQFLAQDGGFSPINHIAKNENIIEINSHKLALSNNFKSNLKLYDDDFLRGEIVISEVFAPFETKVFGFNTLLPEDNNMVAKIDEFSTNNIKAAKFWHRNLGRFDLSINGETNLANAIKTNLAYILLMRDGAMLKPGARSYNRAWIRDGVTIANALLRLGRHDEVGQFINFYSQYQFENGKIPCCVDWRGADAIDENDANGQFIHLNYLMYQYTNNRALLIKNWPQIKRSTLYLNQLREPTFANSEENQRGILPPSISHEGYSQKPAFSYWDNFWALRGFKDAAELAKIVGDMGAFKEFNRIANEFEIDLKDSILKTQLKYGQNFIAGAADIGDFDANATAIASLLNLNFGENANIKDGLNNTFEKYWQNFNSRLKSNDWRDYTPYEWRMVGAFSRSFDAYRASKISEFLLNDIIPRKWNSFPEIVGRNKREMRFLGDLPHGWIGADFINSSLDRLIYEIELIKPLPDADDCKVKKAIIIGAGAPKLWLLKNGIRVTNISTSFGKFSYWLRLRDGKIIFDFSDNFPRDYIILLAPNIAKYGQFKNSKPIGFTPCLAQEYHNAIRVF